MAQCMHDGYNMECVCSWTFISECMCISSLCYSIVSAMRECHCNVHAVNECKPSLRKQLNSSVSVNPSRLIFFEGPCLDVNFAVGTFGSQLINHCQSHSDARVSIHCIMINTTPPSFSVIAVDFTNRQSICMNLRPFVHCTTVIRFRARLCTHSVCRPRHTQQQQKKMLRQAL